MSEAKMSIADAMRSVMTQLRKQTAENNKAREAKTIVEWFECPCCGHDNPELLKGEETA